MTLPSLARDDGAAGALAERLGARADAERATRDRWAIAGVVPALVTWPADADEVATTVADAAACGAALVPLGRGAHRGLGQPPRRYDLALVTERLTNVRAYTPADMTVTVEAGATIADLDALLAREGQWLPIEPPAPATTTVGGLLAADLAGPLAASQGRARDFVIGIEVVTAAGVRARAGGRVVKNVAGYDLMKLFTGSLGTLAVLTEATFKVRPRPETQRGVVCTARGMTAALQLAGTVAKAVDVGALAVVARGQIAADDGEASVIVRLGGVSADVAAARHRLAALARDAGAAITLDAANDDPAIAAAFTQARDFTAAAAGNLVVRFAMLPSRLPTLAAAVAAATTDAGTWRADALRGTLHVALVAEHAGVVLAALTRLADLQQAHLVVERWPPALAGTVAVWHPLPAALPLMRRVKHALDPTGVFAAGRFVGGI